MPSKTYLLFRDAIQGQRQIVCSYNGYHREICPHILGHSKGKEKALTFQFAGESEHGLPPGGKWKCFYLSKVRDSRLRDGPWLSGSEHRKAQSCVEDVDVDVNPESPYTRR